MGRVQVAARDPGLLITTDRASPRSQRASPRSQRALPRSQRETACHQLWQLPLIRLAVRAKVASQGFGRGLCCCVLSVLDRVGGRSAIQVFGKRLAIVGYGVQFREPLTELFCGGLQSGQYFGLQDSLADPGRLHSHIHCCNDPGCW